MGSLRLSLPGVWQSNFLCGTNYFFIYLRSISLLSVPTSNVVGIAYSSFFWFKVGMAYVFTHYKLYAPVFFFFACLIYGPTFIIVDSYWRIYKFGLEAFRYLVLIQSKLTADQNHAMRAMEKSRQDFITVMFSQIISKHLLFFSLKKSIILPKPLFYHQVEL